MKTRTAEAVAFVAGALLVLSLIGHMTAPPEDAVPSILHYLAMAAAGSVTLLVLKTPKHPAITFLTAAFLVTLLMGALQTYSISGYVAEGESVASWAGRYFGEHLGRWAVDGGLASLVIRSVVLLKRKSPSMSPA